MALSKIVIGRWTIWSLGAAKYIQSIKEEKGDTLHDAVATAGFGLFTVGMVAPGLYYGAIGTAAVASTPFVAAAGLGVMMGVFITPGLVYELEEQGIVREGATLDYLDKVTSVDKFVEHIYSPKAVYNNVSTIWNYYNPFDKED